MLRFKRSMVKRFTALINKSIAFFHNKRRKDLEYLERYFGGTVTMAVSTINVRWLSVMLNRAPSFLQSSAVCWSVCFTPVSVQVSFEAEGERMLLLLRSLKGVRGALEGRRRPKGD